MNNFKFAHFADCHIGGWRDKKLHDLSAKSFTVGVNICIDNNVDFVIIAGDLFNNAIPSIDVLKSTISDLKRLHDSNISVYVVAGSHDFSSSGKSIIDVLEKAGLVSNLVKGTIEENKLKLKFTIDEKTSAKLTGLLGRRGTLEKKYYEVIDYSIENEEGFKIFVLHTALSELMPKEFKDIESMNLATLPKNFNYYAAGHVHEVIVNDYYNAPIVYPGPTFPNNFAELEKLDRGSLFIVDVTKNENGSFEVNPKYTPITLHNTHNIMLDCNNLSTIEINEKLFGLIENKEFFNGIVTIRLFGKISSGKINEINFDKLITELYGKGAYSVLKSTSKLEHKSDIIFQDINSSNVDLENEAVNNIKDDNLKLLASDLISSLGQEKHDGERNIDYENRLIISIKELLTKMLE